MRSCDVLWTDCSVPLILIAGPAYVCIFLGINAEPKMQSTIGILQSLPWSLKLAFGEYTYLTFEHIMHCNVQTAEISYFRFISVMLASAVH